LTDLIKTRRHAGLAAVLLEIALVVVLGVVELRRRGDLSHDWIRERRLVLVARCDREPLLFAVVDEDRRAILAAEVPPLAVARGRIVHRPERIQEIVVADHGGVKPHVH
jgi:hypothetical protein